MPTLNIRAHWLVKVYTERVETYRFTSFKDVKTSIADTWSQIRDTVEVIIDPQHSIRVMDKKTRRMLLRCDYVSSIKILDGPTHF